MSKLDGPKILFVDIETLPLEVFSWGVFDQTIQLNMINKDWTVLSWSAKWKGNKKVFYEDTRNEKDPRNDKKILLGIWKLLDEADIVIWQNGKDFDHKKLRARFLINGMKPPSPYRQIDTKCIAKKEFAMTSNSLDYLSKVLNLSHKKSDHRKFAGFTMWRECMKGNKAAFKEMEKYNKLDVLSLENLYDTIQAWSNAPDFNVYRKGHDVVCNCGSKNVHSRGTYRHATDSALYQKFSCNDCGKWFRGKENLLSKEKRKSLKKPI